MRAQTKAGSRSLRPGKKRPAVAAICMQPQRSAAQRLPMKRKTTWRRRAASGPAEASPRRPAAAPPTRRSRARPLHSSTPGWQVALSRLAAIASPADRAGQNRHAFLHPFHCTVRGPTSSNDRTRVAGCLPWAGVPPGAPAIGLHARSWAPRPQISAQSVSPAP